MKFILLVALLSTSVFSYRSDLSKVFDVRHAKLFGVNENFDYDSKKFRCPQGFEKGFADGRVHSCVNKPPGMTPIFVGVFRKVGTKKMENIVYNFDKIKACSKRGEQEAKRIFEQITYKESGPNGYMFKGNIGQFVGYYSCKVSASSKRLELVAPSDVSMLPKTLKDLELNRLKFTEINK